jgi:Circadian oscillating protein COP23
MTNIIFPSLKSIKKLACSLTHVWLLSAALLGSTSTLFQSTPVKAQADEARFYCGKSFNAKKGSQVPTTIVWTPTQKIALLQWVRPMGDHWTPEKRCRAFSDNFTTAYRNGTTRFLTNGKKNGQKVICVAKEVNGDCKSVLMTLRPEDNSLLFLNELKDVLNGKSTPGQIITHSSGEAQLYYEIDLNELLKNGSRVE